MAETEADRHIVRGLALETAFLKRKLQERSELDMAAVRWVLEKSREFYWTATRLVGLGHLHDGSRRESPAGERVLRAIASDRVRHAPHEPSRRIFVDATDTFDAHQVSGIQRVVLELARHLVALCDAQIVVIRNGAFVRLPGLEPVVFREEDFLILADCGWNRLDDYRSSLASPARAGTKIVAIVYDCIPVRFPAAFAAGLSDAFIEWLRLVSRFCVGAIAISRTVAQEFARFLQSREIGSRRPLKIGWYALGFDIPSASVASSGALGELQKLSSGIFVTVGTLEPRKGHATALDAMDKLWAEGRDCAYVIVGRKGWNVEHLVDRIERHPQNGRRLFWFDGLNDSDLAGVYRKAKALVSPSLAEGYGLPLVEAAHFGARIIASDIDVFREVAPNADFFQVANSDELAARLVEAIDLPRIAPPMETVTWRQSAQRLYDILRHDRYQIAFDPAARDSLGATSPA